MHTHLHGLSLHLTVLSENQRGTSQHGRQPAAALPLAHLRDFSARQLGRQRRQVLALLLFLGQALAFVVGCWEVVSGFGREEVQDGSV